MAKVTTYSEGIDELFDVDVCIQPRDEWHPVQHQLLQILTWAHAMGVELRIVDMESLLHNLHCPDEHALNEHIAALVARKLARITPEGMLVYLPEDERK